MASVSFRLLFLALTALFLGLHHAEGQGLKCVVCGGDAVKEFMQDLVDSGGIHKRSGVDDDFPTDAEQRDYDDAKEIKCKEGGVIPRHIECGKVIGQWKRCSKVKTRRGVIGRSCQTEEFDSVIPPGTCRENMCICATDACNDGDDFSEPPPPPPVPAPNPAESGKPEPEGGNGGPPTEKPESLLSSHLKHNLSDAAKKGFLGFNTKSSASRMRGAAFAVEVCVLVGLSNVLRVLVN